MVADFYSFDYTCRRHNTEPAPVFPKDTDPKCAEDLIILV